MTRLHPSTTPEGTPPRDLDPSVIARSGSAQYIIHDTIAASNKRRRCISDAGNMAKIQPSTTPEGTPTKNNGPSRTATATLEDPRPAKIARLATDGHESNPDTQARADHMKTKLLTLILEQQTLGFRTEKTHENLLQDQGWSSVLKQMRECFGTKFRLRTLMSQLNQIRKTYIDLNFLRNQSGFQWDVQNNIIVADAASWDRVLKRESRKRYTRLRQTPIEWYALAEKVFHEGSDSHENQLPDTASDRDRVETQPPSIDGEKTTSNPVLQAITLMAPMFLDQVSTLEYIKFIEVVETGANAEAFLSLRSTTNPETCKAWLILKSSKL